MRNLKKVLSLALALVMLLGMMMVGAGAVDTGFKDDAGIKDDFKAAAAVTKALGVMEGSNGNLNPTGNIVRAEAFILSLRVDGSNTNTIAAKWPVSEKPFNDVSLGKWYAPYLAYGKEMGLIAGNGGNYNPDGNVTVVEYSILLLRQMGFDSARYTGAKWNTNAASDALAAGLYDGLGNINYYTHELTRQEACQMAFNALLYSPAGDRTDFVVTGTKDGTTTTLYSGTNETAAYLVYSQAKGDKTAYDTVTVNEVTTTEDTLGEKAFGLVRTKTTDELGRTAVSYTAARYKLNLLITSGADFVYEGKVTLGKLYADVGENVAKYTWNVKVDGVESEDATVSPAKGSNKTYQSTAPGMVTEVYVHAAEKKVDVLISNCFMGTVSKVVAAKGDNAAYVMVAGMKYETEAFEKGDVVLYTREDKDITSMELATEVTGDLTRITTKSGTKTFTIGGEDYVTSAKGDTSNITSSLLGKSVTFYTDTQGNIMARKGAAAAANEYIYVVAHSAKQDNPDYITSTEYPASIEVYGVTNAGEVVKKNVVKIGSDKIGSGGLSTVTAGVAQAGLYLVDDTEGDSLILSAALKDAPTTDIAVNKPGISYKTNNVGAAKNAVANSDTAFIFITQEKKDNGDMTINNVTVKTGIANIGTAIAQANATLAIDGTVVEAVFVTSSFEDGNSNAAGVVYVDLSSKKQIDAWEDGAKAKWFTYTCVDETGDEVTMTSKKELEGDDVVYEYDEDEFLIGAVPSARVFENAFVNSRKGSTIWLDSVDHSFNRTDDTNVVFIDGDGVDVEGGQVVTLVTASANTTSKQYWDAQVVFVTKAGTTESVVVKPTKPTEGDDKGKVIVETKPGESFVVSGTEQPTKVTIGDFSVTIPENDWGKPAEVRAFAFKGNGTSAETHTLTILDADGNTMYKEEASATKGGVFYVHVVNLTDQQTTVTNKGTTDDNGQLASASGKELDIGTYSWKIVRGTEVVANGSFEIADNGKNPKS